ncbi:MAG: hypothetical protein ACK493_01445, partial [Planctomycetota bacterium]
MQWRQTVSNCPWLAALSTYTFAFADLLLLNGMNYKMSMNEHEQSENKHALQPAQTAEVPHAQQLLFADVPEDACARTASAESAAGDDSLAGEADSSLTPEIALSA